MIKTKAKIKSTAPIPVLTTIKTTILFYFFQIPVGVLVVLSMKNVDKVLVSMTSDSVSGGVLRTSVNWK